MSPRTALILTALAFASTTPSKAVVRGPAAPVETEELLVLAECGEAAAGTRTGSVADHLNDAPRAGTGRLSAFYP